MKISCPTQVPDLAIELLTPFAKNLTLGDQLRPSEEEVLELTQGSDAIYSLLTAPITRKVIEASPQLKVISNMAVGYDNIDLEAAKEHRVIVCNTPGVLTQSTADFTLALLLSLARHLVPADRWIREGAFKGWDPSLFNGVELEGKTLGIIGMGRIGRAVAQRADAFGLKICFAQRGSTKEFPLASGRIAKPLPLEKLLPQSDILSLHCPATPQTHHLLDRKALSLLPPHCLVINTARGTIIDEEALAERLSQKALAGAALDVFEKEPEIHPQLLKLPNVLLAPHLGSSTHTTRRKMAQLACENLIAVLQKKEPQARVL